MTSVPGRLHPLVEQAYDELLRELDGGGVEFRPDAVAVFAHGLAACPTERDLIIAGRALLRLAYYLDQVEESPEAAQVIIEALEPIKHLLPEFADDEGVAGTTEDNRRRRAREFFAGTREMPAVEPATDSPPSVSLLEIRRR